MDNFAAQRGDSLAGRDDCSTGWTENQGIYSVYRPSRSGSSVHNGCREPRIVVSVRDRRLDAMQVVLDSKNSHVPIGTDFVDRLDHQGPSGSTIRGAHRSARYGCFDMALPPTAGPFFVRREFMHSRNAMFSDLH